jgi:uncharacterized protein
MTMVRHQRRLRTSDQLVFLPTPSDCAIYHRIHGDLCLVDERTTTLFKQLREPQEFSRSDDGLWSLDGRPLGSFVEKFLPRGFLVEANQTEDNKIDERMKDRLSLSLSGAAVKIVQLVVSNECNFHCKYCFVNSIYSFEERVRLQEAPENRTMRAEDACRYVEEVIRLARRNATPGLMIQFFGGEPLISWPTIAHVLDYFGDGRNHGLKLRYSIVTNGSLITPQVADTLAKCDVAVLLSFDSPRANIMETIGAKGPRRAVLQGLSLLRDRGVRMAFNTVLSNETWDHFDLDIVAFAAENGVHEIGVLLDLSFSFYTQKPTEQIVEKVLALHAHGKASGVVVTGYWHMTYQHVVASRSFEATGFKTCSGTGVQLSIEPTGAVFACKGSSGYFGHVLDLDAVLASESWRRYSRRAVTTSPKCRGCEIEYFCSGYCLGPLEKRYGDIFEREENACGVYRGLVRGLIRSTRKYEIDSFHLLD